MHARYIYRSTEAQTTTAEMPWEKGGETAGNTDDGRKNTKKTSCLPSCLGCAEPGKYLTLGIVKILPTTKSSKKIQF